jgi:hypothetical protein
VEKLLWWDADTMALDPAQWDWFRRVGHPDEMKRWEASAHAPRSVVLTEVEGMNVTDSFLQQAVYSGG